MISDNFVIGDNVFLKELQDFFFRVLGMMSITHYGAIGDGRHDNYKALQIAIDDAHRRGLNYLYVPYGRFIYTGTLINEAAPGGRSPIVFIGNPHAKIVNIRTGVEIPIKQFGTELVDIQNIENALDVFENDITTLFTTKQDKLIAGTGIMISSGNVISATGGSTVVDRNIATIRPNLPQTLENGANRIVFNGGEHIGDKLTVNQSSIVVGSGVSKIMVSGSVEVYRGANLSSDVQDVLVEIVKPTEQHFEETLAQARTSFYAGQQYASIVIPPTLVSVEPGDEIFAYLSASLLEGDNGTTGSNLTVEVVEFSDEELAEPTIEEEPIILP